jgi:hypothetical protein
MSWAVFSSERKYESGTVSSRMSDNKDPFSVLGHLKVFTVKHLPFDIIPQFIQRGEDCGERPSLVVIE